MQPNHFQFSAPIWVYSGKAAWHFISVPADVSADIRQLFGSMARGWGSLRVKVKIGSTTWETSIFPDTKTSTYLLPLKADVRQKESLTPDALVSVDLEIKL